MRVRLAKPLNFETAHGIFTKFHKNSQKTLPNIDKNSIEIGAYTGQLAPKISSKSMKIFYHFYSSKIFQKIQVTNSVVFSWVGNLVVSLLFDIFSEKNEKKLLHVVKCKIFLISVYTAWILGRFQESFEQNLCSKQLKNWPFQFCFHSLLFLFNQLLLINFSYWRYLLK